MSRKVKTTCGFAIAVLSVVLVAALLTGCSAGVEQEAGSTPDSYRLTCEGRVTERFTEGAGEDTANCIQLELDDGQSMVFTVTDSTQPAGAEGIELGDYVIIECEGYSDSEYHPILTIEVKQEELTDRIPMVMVDGRLYYDTGKESTRVNRPQEPDGEITSTVDGTQIPTEDDQSNFGAGYVYQYGENDTIEVCLNGKWMVYEYRSRDDSKIRFRDQMINTNDLSQETLDWLTWFNGLSETEQDEVTDLPDDLAAAIAETAVDAVTDVPAAIMVENTVYYLNNDPMLGEVDESAVIGYTQSYTDGLPAKEGETNFNRELGMPYARVKEGIAVLYENEWHLCIAK